MLSLQQRFTMLFMAAVFHIEFVPNAELYKTANYLRTLGIQATVVEEPKERIVVETESYNSAMEKLTPIVANLPDFLKLTWLNGETENLIIESTLDKTDIFLKDAEITDSLKVLRDKNGSSTLTVILKDDKNTVIRYQNIVRKIENMGFKVTFAEGFKDAGWIQFPVIEIEVPNNVAGFRDALVRLSELPDVNRFSFNSGKNVNTNDYTVIYEEKINLEKEISKYLANGIEVYKIDRNLNKLFVHFPSAEAQNKIKLEKVKAFDGLVALKSVHENSIQYSDSEFKKNVRSIWLQVPNEVLAIQNSKKFEEALTKITFDAIKGMQEKGMIVLHYGFYGDSNELSVPEVTFTYRDKDSPKAEEIVKVAEGKNITEKTVVKLEARTCSGLF